MSMIESEEQADEAFFSKLDTDLARHYADLDADMLADRKQQIQEAEEESNVKTFVYSNYGRQTILTARLRYCHKRDAYKVAVPFGKSFDDFKEWFLYSKIWKENKDLINFDGQYLSWKNGAVMATLFLHSDTLIYVTFDDYFSGWLASEVREAKEFIEQLADHAKQRLS